MAVVIVKCTCEHSYQDKKYGLGKRVMNTLFGKNSNKARCTVCGKEVSY